nr:hypothetical protein [bacterium]
MVRFFFLLIIGCYFFFATASEFYAEEFDFGFLNEPQTEDTKPSNPTDYSSKNFKFNFTLEQSLRLNSKNSKIESLSIPLYFFDYWNNRLTLSTRLKIKFFDNLALNFYDRLNYLNDGDNRISSAIVNNDINELYLSYNINSLNTFEAGRINVKNGAAIGFNPTDYLKIYAGNEKVSDDPIVLRENRLGVLMARFQNINKFGSFSVIAVPHVNTRREKFLTTRGSFPLNLNKTNSSEKYLFKLETNIFNNIQPEILYLYERDKSGFGANISTAIGDNIIAYAEWSGKKTYNILMETILKYCYDYGISQDLPKTYLPDFIKKKKFKNQLSAGFSFAEKKYKRSTFIEYHYNENGLEKNYLKYITESPYYNDVSPYFNELYLYQAYYYLFWAARDNVNNLMEPYSKHQIFARNQWNEAFVNKLNLITMFQYNILDKSFYTKFITEYNCSSRLILNASIVFYKGGILSEYG